MNARVAVASLVVTSLLLLAGAVRAADAVIATRPGGLLPCEELPGEALQMRRPDPIIVPRADGGVTALFFFTFEPTSGRPNEIVYADLTNGASRSESLPAGIGNAWARLWGPDGRLYLGLWGPATLLRYDPVKDRVETFADNRGVLEPDGKSVPMLTVGADEKVYALCSSLGHVFSVDPATDAIVRYGPQGPERKYDIAYRGSFAVDDEWIYSTFGNIPNETFTVAKNKATREWHLLEGIQGAHISQGRLGVTARLGDKDYWLYQGKAVEKKAKDEKPPWPEREPAARTPAPKLAGRVELLPNSILMKADGAVTIWYRLDRKQPWRSLTFQGKPSPLFLRAIGALPDGRVFASATYSGIYTFNPAGGAFAHEGIVPCSNYAAVVVDGKVYLASYPGGNSLFVWDPAKPWTVDKATPERAAPDMNGDASNPRRLPVLAHGLKDVPYGFQHPWFLVRGNDNALYALIHGERYNVGGMLVWRGLDDDARGFLRDPFLLYDPEGLCTALDGGKVVVAGRAIAGIKDEPKPSAGRLFVIDVKTHKLEWTLDPLPGNDSSGMVAEGRPGELAGAAFAKGAWLHERKLAGEKQADAFRSVLYKVDMKTRQVTQRIEVAGALAGRREYYWLVNFVKGPDGMIYTLHDDMLVRIDPATLAITAVSKVGAVGRIAFVGRDIYLSGTSHFRRVRGALLNRGGE